MSETSRFRAELHFFFTALSFLSRIPSPALRPYHASDMPAATRYFPLAGMVLGGLVALIYGAALALFPVYLAIALAMAFSLWLTVCFHEDGFADFCDGFGGGWSSERILEIMKDSRLGTYGSSGLLGVLAIKFMCLISIAELGGEGSLVFVLIWGYGLSRLIAISFKLDMDYVQPESQSKVFEAAERLPLAQFLYASLPLLLLLPSVGLVTSLITVVVLFALHVCLKRYFLRWIGGFTGDCLGAAQQMAELMIYLCWVALLA